MTKMLWALALTIASGCAGEPAPSPQALVPGTWQRHDEYASERLVLAADGTFDDTVTSWSGPMSTGGTYTVDDTQVHMVLRSKPPGVLFVNDTEDFTYVADDHRLVRGAYLIHQTDTSGSYLAIDTDKASWAMLTIYDGDAGIEGAWIASWDVPRGGQLRFAGDLVDTAMGPQLDGIQFEKLGDDALGHYGPVDLVGTGSAEDPLDFAVTYDREPDLQ